MSDLSEQPKSKKAPQSKGIPANTSQIITTTRESRIKWPADAPVRKTVAELIPYARNARTHSEAQVAQIAASIREWGWTNPILIDETGGIIAGHGRVLAARKLKIEEVPCIIASGWSEAQKRAYILADNQLATNAGWDMDLLKVEIGDLKAEGFELGLIGFDGDFLDSLMAPAATDGLTDPDDVPEVSQFPVSATGDVWQLGKHRLVCGDSTDALVLDKALDGKLPDLVYTDPPYGINVKGMRAERGGMTKNSKVPDFDDSGVQAAIDCYTLVEAMGIKRQVWWGANYYCHALPQTNNWFVWDKRVEDKHSVTESDCELAWVKSKWSSVRIFRHLWKGMLKDSERGEKRVHATQKPVALAEWAFDYYKDVKTVADFFAGSGSTLIACEKTGRQFYGVELMPAYCDVIVKRWQQFTGKEATLDGTDRTFNEIQEARHVPA